MSKITNSYVHYPEWTESRFWTFIRSALRMAWNKYPVKYQVINDAFVCVQENIITGRNAKHYRCAICKELFPLKGVVVDHVVQVGTLKGYDDLPNFVRRLFCGKDNLQVVCKKCHKKKNKEEKKFGKKNSLL